MNEGGTEFTIVMEFPTDSGIDQVAIDNRAKIVSAYQDMIDGHSDALFDLLDDTVEFFEAESLPYGASKKGKQQVIAGVEGMFGAWKRLDINIHQILTAGDSVIAYLNMRSVSRVTGETYEGPTAELFRFRAGKIVEWRPVYWDTHQVRKVCGIA